LSPHSALTTLGAIGLNGSGSLFLAAWFERNNRTYRPVLIDEGTLFGVLLLLVGILA
jgi:hypothetical protein